MDLTLDGKEDARFLKEAGDRLLDYGVLSPVSGVGGGAEGGGSEINEILFVEAGGVGEDWINIV